MTIPCGTCRACCIGQLIEVMPEDPAHLYQTRTIIHPTKGKPVKILQHQPDGSCAHLGHSGCTIYEDRPTVCRRYDCGLQYLTLPRRQRIAMRHASPNGLAVMKAGRAIQKFRRDAADGKNPAPPFGERETK